jgi:hypothetical protein
MPSFSKKVETQVVMKYLTDVASALEQWVTLVTHQIAASIDFSLALRQMDISINFLRQNFKNLHLEYNRLDAQYEIDLLNPDYLNKYKNIVVRIEAALNDARQIAYKYDEVLKQCQKQNYNTSKYLSNKNKQAIDKMFDLTTEAILKLLEDANLLGF